MTIGLFGKKLGMTQIFADDGTAVPVTFIKAETLVWKSTTENTILYGNPRKQRGTISKKLISKINKQNNKFSF